MHQFHEVTKRSRCFPLVFNFNLTAEKVRLNIFDAHFVHEAAWPGSRDDFLALLALQTRGTKLMAMADFHMEFRQEKQREVDKDTADPLIVGPAPVKKTQKT